MSGIPASCDYLVIGSGAAGAAVAARLSEDPDARVVLLEAGGKDRSPLSRLPGLGFAIGAHRFETPDAAALAAVQGKPALAIWGEADRTLGAEHFLPLFSELFPAAPIHRLAGVGHYSFEDAPHQISRLIAEFLQAT